MKKHLLFAAMLTLCVAPAVATPVASLPFYAAEDNTATLEESYQALVKSINDLKQDLEAKASEIQEKYPDAEETLGTIQFTLTGDGGLGDLLKEVNAKYEAKTLTTEEIATYQSTVATWSDNFKNVVSAAETEHYQGEMQKAWQDATDKVSDAQAELPDNVYDYFSSAMDAAASDISTLYSNATSFTAESVAEYKAKADEIAEKAIAVAAPAEAASGLVKDMKAYLPTNLEQINKGKVDFPDYDWESVMEYGYDYWKAILDKLTDYYNEEDEVYTKADIDDMVEMFGYYQEENPYAAAQKEAWQGEYFTKYYPVSNRISEINAILDQECPTVASKYMEKLEDLNGEMTQAANKFYGDDPISQDDFNAMMARLDEISKEIEKILADAKAEEAATGIDQISIDQLDKDAKVYTLDGKRVTNVQKGLYIVNGKKVILK